MAIEEESKKQTDIVDEEDLPHSGPGPYPEFFPHSQVNQLDDSSTGHTFMIHAVSDNFFIDTSSMR
jgi:hypothetical protein